MNVVNCFQNYYLCKVKNNLSGKKEYSAKVVNCFQNYYLCKVKNNRD